MSEKNKPLGGNITVSMGNSNNVEHIGHVFHRPPPAPNAIIQNGAEVGLVIEGADPKSINGNTATFGRLSHQGAFNPQAPFTIHQFPDVVLKIVSVGADGVVSMGGPPTYSLSQVLVTRQT